MISPRASRAGSSALIAPSPKPGQRSSPAAERAGRPPPILDAFVAATALVHQLTLVTRNERDLAGLDVPIVNPWRA